MNMPLTGIEYADCIILVGFNPRLEAPLVNTRIQVRKLFNAINSPLQQTYHENKCKVGIVGLKMNLGYNTNHLGASPDTISELADGTHSFCEVSHGLVKFNYFEVFKSWMIFYLSVFYRQ